ncbi:MAG: YebC/PmpR family DNA-binding transcriptional regulator [Steroidobacteraceae bacterium]
MTEAHDDQIICGEGYGPGGVAVLVTCREPASALAEAVRRGFAAHGGQSGAHGSVAYLFNAVGVLEFATGVPVNKTRSFAYECGAEDVRVASGGALQVITDPAELSQVRSRLGRRGCHAMQAQVTRLAASPIVLTADQALDLQELLTALRNIAGVSNVYSNAEVPQILA